MKRLAFLSVCMSVLFLLPGRVVSQTDGRVQAQTEPIKIGVALSAGGAKGFAHIGVLKVLEEENIPVHIITGSSMGAVVGGLYSAGYSTEQIRDIALSTDWQVLFNDNLKPSSRDLSTFISTRDTYLLSFPIVNKRPQLPAGLVGGQNLSMLLYRLLLPYHDIEDFSTLPVSFAAIATDLSTGKARRFETGYLPEVIRASAAIPTIFKPVTIQDGQYIDGGVARSIPVEDAREMGADLVLASNVGEPVKPLDSLNTFVDILFQSVGFHQIESDSVQVDLADFYVRPDIEEYDSFSYDNVDGLIRRGEEATRAIIPQIKAALDSLHAARTPDRPNVNFENPTFTIAGVNYQNINSRLLRQVEHVLDFKLPQQLTYSDIERKVNRLYSTGYFSLISYRLREDPTADNGKILFLGFTNARSNRLGISMRYDSRYKASLLFGLQLRNLLGWGDRFTADIRLGEILGVSTHYDMPIFLKPSIKIHTDMELNRSPIDFYTNGERLTRVEVERVSFLPSFSLHFKSVELQAGLRAELYDLNETVGENLFFVNDHFLFNGAASLIYNGLNRSYFPTRGQRLTVTAETSSERFLSETTFSQIVAEWRTALPLYDGVELRTRFIAGQSSTPELPLHYRFYQGGLIENPYFRERQSTLWGYALQQLSGSSLAAARASLQFHLGRDIYLQTGWNAAHLSEARSWKPGEFEFNHGYGVSIGALTLAGPVNLSISTPNFTDNYAIKVDIGYSF